jgi:hypothetical protein
VALAGPPRDERAKLKLYTFQVTIDINLVYL